MTWAKFRNYISQPRIWLYGYMFGSSTLGSYSLAYFLPAILATMGFTNIQAQLLVAPPYVWAAIPALSTAYLADRVKNFRAGAITFNALCLIVGTCMYSQLDKTHKAARYAGIFLAIGGCNSNVPLIISWAQTSIRSQSKRGFTSALIVAWGGIGGILASVAFQQVSFAFLHALDVFSSSSGRFFGFFFPVLLSLSFLFLPFLPLPSPFLFDLTLLITC